MTDRTPSDIDIPFEKHVLPNGLQLILHIDRKLPIVHVNQWFHVGSKNERVGRTGFAHLFEHMMFQGSANATDDYFRFVEAAGANLREGGVNGTTSEDRTNYFATVPSGNLEFLLWLESDRLATLTEALTQEKLDNQRDVVKNERRQSYENVPYGRWDKLLVESLHPAGHPYSWPVIGSHEDLTAATVEDVKEFFHAYYTPNNLSLVIAGDFDRDEAIRLVEKYFGPIATGPVLDRPRRWLPFLHSTKVVEARDRVPQERTYMIWPGAAYFDPDDAVLDLTARILSDGLSSRLNRSLVYDRQICSDATAFNASYEISGAFAIIATARPGIELDEVERVIDEEIEKLAKSGPTSEELNRARTKREFDFISGLERIGGFGGKADLLNQYNTFLGDPAHVAADLQRYRDVTAAGVRDAVKRTLTGPRVLIHFRPEKSERATESEVNRAEHPKLGVDRPFPAPEVSKETLDNGLEVFVVERRELPKVAVIFTSRAGSVSDPDSKPGVAYMTATVLTMGTKKRSAFEIEDGLGDLGTSLSSFSGRETSALSMEVLSRHLDPALEIFSDAALHPTFPDSEFQREKMLHLDALAQDENNPNAVAGRVRSMLTFGHGHPYGRPARGLPGSVKTILRDDLAEFHKREFNPANSALIFVGDITMNTAVDLARRHFGKWKKGPHSSPDFPAPSPISAAPMYLVDRQGAAQTVVSLALPAPKRKSEDYYALRLADAVWGGGGFGTRLNLNLREDKGYSYGVFSNQALNRHTGIWWASGAVQTDKTAESVIEFIRELDLLAGKKPITEEELENARATRIRGYAQQFESLMRIAGQIAELWSAGLSTDELQREIDQTARITLEQANQAAQRYAKPDRAILLLVGDLKKIAPGLKELRPIVELDVEGRVKGKS